jgi:tagatose 6-phosphate kinase
LILSAGLSPAWQAIVVLESLRLGEVNRAREMYWSASGKVLNAARAVHRLRGEGGRGASRALTIFGGRRGEAMAASLAAEGLDLSFVKSATQCRVCITVIDSASRSTTELVENAGPVAERELEEFRARFREEAAGAELVILTGSLPAGAPPDYYRSLLSGIRPPAILDIRGPELLQTLELRPFLVKPNREELARTAGMPLRTEEELRAAMLDLSRRGAEWVVVSQGRDAVWAHGGGRFFRFRPPRVKAVNPIGSGDCLAGGMASALAAGLEPLEAIRTGIACASENASVLLPADIERSRVERRRSEVALEEA